VNPLPKATLNAVWGTRRPMYLPSATLARFCISTAPRGPEQQSHCREFDRRLGRVAIRCVRDRRRRNSSLRRSVLDDERASRRQRRLGASPSEYSRRRRDLALRRIVMDEYERAGRRGKRLGASPSDIYAVGATIMHYDGTSWTAVGEIAGGSGVWDRRLPTFSAVGGDLTASAILHYDGTTWTPMTAPSGSPTLRGVWGSSPSDVFAAGSGGILHYDGTSWTPMEGTGWLNSSVWGSSASDVFAVGKDDDLAGVMLHYDGSSWASITSGTTGDLSAVWGPRLRACSWWAPTTITLGRSCTTTGLPGERWRSRAECRSFMGCGERRRPTHLRWSRRQDSPLRRRVLDIDPAPSGGRSTFTASGARPRPTCSP